MQFIQERLKLGLAKSTFRAYQKAMKELLDFAKASNKDNLNHLDDIVVDFIFHLPEERRKTALEKLLADIGHFLPKMKDSLHVARRLSKQLKKSYIPTTKPPMLFDVLLMIIRTLLLGKKGGSAMALWLQFECFLRPNELCELTTEDVAFPGNNALGNFIKCGVILLRCTKTGPMQIVELRRKDTIDLMKRLVAIKEKGQKLFPQYTKLSNNFAWALQKIGLQNIGYTLHSIRHGAATQNFLNEGFEAIPAIMHRGRWESKAVKKYLQSGAALLVNTRLPENMLMEAKTVEKALPQLFALHGLEDET